MVNTGKPSFGCQNCKKVHKKCDQSLPACAQCVRKRQKCEYPDVLSIIFRDETRAIRTKSDRRRRQVIESAPQETLALPPNSQTTWTSLVSPFTCVGATQEHFALAVLFSRRAGTENDKENPHGFMGLLPQLFAMARPNSPLERATHALALFVCQHVIDYRGTTQSCLHLADRMLGEALRLTSDAIQDSNACCSDDTLMAVMVLNIIDKIVSMVDQRRPSDTHLLGALQLISLRGKKNFSNKASQRILAGVHSEIVGKALRRCVPVNDISGGFCSNVWVGGLSQHPNSAMGLLNYLAERVANVQATVRELLDRPSLFDDAQANTLMVSLLEIDRGLMDWEFAIPDAWRPEQAGELSKANRTAFHTYGMTMDIYKSVWIANIYNCFRTLRILLQVLAHDIIRSYPWVIATALPCGPLAYSCIAQRLIDEVCASVPFLMGNRGPLVHPANVLFPAAEGSVPSMADRHTALQVGAWLLLAPLNTCFTCDLVDMRQKIWIASQIERITSFHNLPGSYYSCFPNWQINLDGTGISVVAAKASTGV